MIWGIILSLALAFPVGLFISLKAKDELKAGRPYFKFLIFASLAVGIIGGLMGRPEITLTTGFMIIVSFIALWKSFEKK